MEKEELLIQELSRLTGAEVDFRPEDKFCEIAVSGHVLMLRYRPEDDDWLYFGVVADFEEEIPRDTLVKALELNLFGSGTLALHLGLFGKAFILSGTVPMEGLTAEKLAERLVFLAGRIGELSGDLLSAENVSAPDGEIGSAPLFDSGFMQV